MSPKILIAEDDPSLARLLQSSLESAGFHVIQAGDSASAWSMIQTQELVLALIDTNVRGLRESNVLSRVRADPALSYLPVVILGKTDSPEEAVEWLNLGADDYISRSVSGRLLTAGVHARLRHGRLPSPAGAR